MKIHIIGGGVIGLCSAYYLQQAGHEVTVIDQGDFATGCSFGNAGMVVPSHFIPLASPGVIAKGLKWMFQSSSPFFIKPRLDLSLLQWLWEFYRACHPDRVQAAMPIIRDLNQGSKELYHELSKNLGLAFDFEAKGLIMLYRSAKGGQEELDTAATANQIGVEARVLTPTEVQQLEPNTTVNSLGGVLYPGDAHLSPHQFMSALINELKQKGATFIPQTQVKGWQTNKGKITHFLSQDGKKIAVDQVVLAAGSWSEKLLRGLDIKMPIQDGKGYSVTLSKPANRPTLPSILSEDKVAITPMGEDLRFGGTLELGGMKTSVNPKRVQGILSALPQYYPDVTIPKQDSLDIWLGFRPCSPDGLPYIGRSRKVSNLVIAGGHAMMGLSLGPVTGKLVAEIMDEKKPSINLSLLHPERFA